MYYFNPENFGFYTENSKGMIKISDKEYWSLINGQSQGNAIVLGEDGRPQLQAVEKTDEEILSEAMSRRDSQLGLASLRIGPLQYAVELGIATETDIENLNLWKQYSIDINRVSEQPKYPHTITWPTPPFE